jgi:hypothetical protein
VYTADHLVGAEIEIRPHDGEWTGLHTAVRARHMGAIVRHAGVFGSLAVGVYDLRVRHGASEVLTVTVKSGTVVETHL